MGRKVQVHSAVSVSQAAAMVAVGSHKHAQGMDGGCCSISKGTVRILLAAASVQ